MPSAEVTNSVFVSFVTRSWFIFNFLCNVQFLTWSLSFPLRRSRVSVVLLLSLLLRCKILPHFPQVARISQAFIDGVCAAAAICLPLHIELRILNSVIVAIVSQLYSDLIHLHCYVMTKLGHRNLQRCQQPSVLYGKHRNPTCLILHDRTVI